MLTAAVQAQGSGGPISYPPGPADPFPVFGTCLESQEWRYLGCAEFTPPSDYPLSITGAEASALSDTPQPVRFSYFPGWVDVNSPLALSSFENSVTPANCTTACRGHGYRVAALANNQCSCGGAFPAEGIIDQFGPDSPDSACYTGLLSERCDGDPTQQCEYSPKRLPYIAITNSIS